MLERRCIDGNRRLGSEVCSSLHRRRHRRGTFCSRHRGLLLRRQVPARWLRCGGVVPGMKAAGTRGMAIANRRQRIGNRRRSGKRGGLRRCIFRQIRSGVSAVTGFWRRGNVFAHICGRRWTHGGGSLCGGRRRWGEERFKTGSKRRNIGEHSTRRFGRGRLAGLR